MDPRRSSAGEAVDDDLVAVELQPAYDTGSDAWWRAQPEAPDEAALFSAAYDGPPAPVPPRTSDDDAPALLAQPRTTSAAEPVAVEPAAPEPVATEPVAPEPVAREPLAPAAEAPLPVASEPPAPDAPPASTDARPGLAELLAAREALGAQLREARRPLDRRIVPPPAPPVVAPVAAPLPPAADAPATTFADLVSDDDPPLDASTDELRLPSPSAPAGRRQAPSPVEPVVAPDTGETAWWVGEATPDVVPAAASPGRRSRGRRPRRLPSTGPVRAVSGALVSLAGVLLLVGAVLLVTEEEPAGGPVVAQPRNLLTDGASAQPSAGGPAPTTAAAQPTAAVQPTAAPSPAAVAPVVRVPVTVLNNSNVNKLAARAAEQFKAAGWPIRETGNFTGRIDATTVYYAPGQQQAAQALADAFPQIARVRPRFDALPGQGLTVVLTRDYQP